MNNRNKILFFITALALIPTISRAQTWTAPTQTPPAGNVSAPINTSATTQGKMGNFGIGKSTAAYPLDVTGIGYFTGSVRSVGLLNEGTSYFAGNVGIGIQSPTTKLDVVGTVKATGLQITGGTPGSNKVLTSDSSGNATWQAITTTSGISGSGTTNYLSKWSSASAITNSIIFDNGTNVGIGTALPGAKLDVNGTVKVTNLQVTSGAGSGKVLTSDGSGNAAWTTPGTGGTVTSIIAGTGLTGGTITTSGTIAVDSAVYQKRISTACSTGQFVRSVDVNGVPTCATPSATSEADTLATVTARGATTTAISTFYSGLITNGVVNSGGETISGSLSVGGNTSVTGTVGIGVTSPTEKLEVAGKIKTTNLQVTGGTPVSGKVLTSDASGNATWTDPAVSINQNITATNNSLTIVSDGSTVTLDVNPSIFQKRISTPCSTGYAIQSVDVNGVATCVAVGSGGSTDTLATVTGRGATTATASTFSGGLTIGGTLTITGGTPGSGKVLTSDGSGNATWQAITTTSGISGSGTTNYLSKWSSASAITNSIIFDNGTNVGVGVTNPKFKVDVNSTAVGNDIDVGNSSTGILTLGGGTINDGSSTDIVKVDGVAHKILLGDVYSQGSGSYVSLNTGPGSLDFFANSDDQLLHIGPDEAYIDASGNSISLKSQGNTKVIMKGTGEVGIGVTNPTEKLEVGGKVKATSLQITGGTPGSGKVLTSDGSGNAAWTTPGTGGTVTSIIAGTGLTGGTITTSGTIAVDSAVYQKRISTACSTGQFVRSVDVNGVPTCATPSATSEADTLATVTARGATTNTAVGFAGVSVTGLLNTGSEAVLGNVGIGTANPTERLVVTNGDDAKVKIYSNGGSVGIIDTVANSNESTGRWLYINPTGGNIAIGTTLPQYMLDVAADIRARGSMYSTAYYYSSDRSLKKNIQPLVSSLEKVKKLQGVSFDWKKNDAASVGLIAQDVEKVYPELVSTDTTGLKSVQYGNLVAPLIEAIKEQQKQIDELKAEVAALKAR